MSVHKFQVIFNHDNGLAEDRVVNGWHFHSDVSPAIDFDNVRDMLQDFYSTPAVGTRISSFMPTHLDPTVLIVAYDLEQPKPRAPVYESSWPLDGGTGSTIPTEVALCFSFEAAKESGQSQARRRNRVYLGPFQNTAISSGVPSGTLMDSIVTAGQALKQASDAAISWDWVVYSATDGAHHEPAHIWCDNAWDTQRRRGLRATAREQVFFE